MFGEFVKIVVAQVWSQQDMLERQYKVDRLQCRKSACEYCGNAPSVASVCCTQCGEPKDLQQNQREGA